jgi:polynucleotide 5'-hydroxyl-kinase GRC3/NOL9
MTSGRTVGEGKTVLVSGPASVVLVKGRVTVLGSTISEDDKIVVRKGRTVPFESEEESVLDVVLGMKGEMWEISGSTIPASWKRTFDEIRARPKPLTACIVGGVDRGKTTLCTYLANKAYAHNIISAVVDADVGQSSVGPPATISYGILTKQVTDLFSLEPTAIRFIGQTCPTHANDRVVHALTRIAEQILEAEVPFTVINTDGWIEGTTAREFKLTLLRVLRPDLVIGVQLGDEAEHVLQPAEAMGYRVFRVPPSSQVRRRDQDARRELREQGYMKYLKNAVLRSLPLNWIQFVDTCVTTNIEQDTNRIDTFQEKLRVRVRHYDETAHEVVLVIDDERDVDRSKIDVLEEELGKTIRLVGEGEEKGLLVGVLDQNRQYLGLGVVHSIDFRTRTIKLFTPIKEKIDAVQFGRVQVDRYGREFGTTTIFTSKTA